jgi:hypothetical protein
VTSSLTRMNMYLHNNPTATIRPGNKLAAPEFFAEDGSLKTFDYEVADPPFNDKCWGKRSRYCERSAHPLHSPCSSFAQVRSDCVCLAVAPEQLKQAIAAHPEFVGYTERITALFADWYARTVPTLRVLDRGCHPKAVIHDQTPPKRLNSMASGWK